MPARDDDRKVDRLHELMRVLDRQLRVAREQCVRIDRYQRIRAARANAQRWKARRPHSG